MKSLWAPGLGRYLLLHPVHAVILARWMAASRTVPAGARPRLLALSPGDGERKFGRTP